MMVLSWVSFWITFFIAGCLLHQEDTIMIQPVTTTQLLNTLGLNAVLSFLFIPIANSIPTLIIVPDTWLGYMTRIILSLLIGDIIFYTSHRLLHYFY